MKVKKEYKQMYELMDAVGAVCQGWDYGTYAEVKRYFHKKRVSYETWVLLEKAYENEDFILFCKSQKA